MTLFRNRYRIESTRCPNWDYSSPGFYYVTICTHDRLRLFGQVVNGEMALSEHGAIADHAWRDLPNHYPHVVLDKYVIMPNHVHGVIQLLHDRDVRVGSVPSSRAGASVAGADAGDTTGDDDDPDFDPDCDDGDCVADCVVDGGVVIVETGFKPVSTTPSTTPPTTPSTTPPTTPSTTPPTTPSGSPTTTPPTDDTPATDPIRAYRRHGLSEIIRAFNTFSARRVNVARGTPGTQVWQPRFHDHIVRDERELLRIRRYIMNNPRNWQKDKLRGGSC